MPLVYSPRFVAVNSAGIPYPNARLYVYKATTLNALSTFTDETFGTPHSQPITADANGLFPAIYQDPSSGFDLHFILKTSADVLIWDEDNIPRSQTVFSSVTTGAIVADSALITNALQAYPINISGAAPYLLLNETDAAANNRQWRLTVDGNILSIATKTDAGAVGKDAIAITRSGTTISAINIGNSSDASTISMNGIVFSARGSFTATLTGMTAATTGNIYYELSGHIVTLFCRTSIFGTSNSTAMTITGIPTSIMPSDLSKSSFICYCTPFIDNSTGIAGTVKPLSTSSLTCGTGTLGSANNWTAANAKGLSDGWTVTYPLNI